MFSEIYCGYNHELIREWIASSSIADVKRALAMDHPDARALCALLSVAAGEMIEKLAQRSRLITRQRFGSVMQLYAPLYISNECNNRCLYCGFNADNKIKRRTLKIDEIKNEADLLLKDGFRHILLLTGESRQATPVNFIREVSKIIHKNFDSVSIEMYPMETDEYAGLASAGIDGLTLYQETYDRETYLAMHPAGPKRDFLKRMDAPDRGGLAGFRKIGIGFLLGLSDFRTDAFYTAMHAAYLSKKYWQSHITVSFPRIREAPGGFAPRTAVDDLGLAQLICAVRIILKDTGLALSTREPAKLRDSLASLGITMMSAGSKTAPGGYGDSERADGQFSVEDGRSPAEIADMLKKIGLCPVWKDWDKNFIKG
jgi:2-iminoacetate synthase